MTIKAIVLDVDGTLLDNNKRISDRTREALIDAQKKGIKVILASGRPTSGMALCAEKLLLEEYEGLLVTFNGASVVDCKTHKELFNQPLSIELAKRILRHLEKFDVIPMVGHNEFMYVNDVYANISTLPKGESSIICYESRGGCYKLCEVDNLADFVYFPLNKILIAGEPDYLQANYEAIQAPFEEQTNHAFSAPIYFEFTDKGIDKAKALNIALSQFDIQPEEVMAFGDGHNDRSIIEYAGVGVAMGNAVEEIKAIADEVTLSNEEDGIAVALEKYV